MNSAGTFDTQLSTYINTTYVQLKYVPRRRKIFSSNLHRYQTLFGCDNISLTNTTNLYARYTTSVVCNGIIQNSKSRCNLAEANSCPMCANSCADYALSESVITGIESLCSNPSDYTDTQIRADFTNCALPAQSLQNSECISGAVNEPSNCGFGGSLSGLCTYCSQSAAADNCCSTSQAGTRCANVVIPSSISTISLPTSTSSASSGGATPTSSSAPTSQGTATGDGVSRNESRGLSGTTIAVIVVGVVVGVVLLCLLAFLLFCCSRRRRNKKTDAAESQHQQKLAALAAADMNSVPSLIHESAVQRGPTSDYTVLPGGRIARKSALYNHTVTTEPPTHKNFGTSQLASETPHRSLSPLPPVVSGESRRGRTARRPASVPPPADSAAKIDLARPGSVFMAGEDRSKSGSSIPTSNPAAYAALTSLPIPAATAAPPTKLAKKQSPDRPEKAPSPPSIAADSDYTILPGGRMARTSAVPRSLNSLANPFITAQASNLSKEPTPDHPAAIPSQVPTSNNHVETKLTKTTVPAPRDPKFGDHPASSSDNLKDLFPYPRILLGDTDPRVEAAQRDTAAPTAAVEAVKTRNNEPTPSIMPESAKRRLETAASPAAVAQPSAAQTSQQASQQASQQDANSMPETTYEYKELPGGRLVRTAVMKPQTNNEGTKPVSHPLSGSVGASAVAAAAKIRQSDERSRASKRAPATVPVEHLTPPASPLEMSKDAKGKGKEEIFVPELRVSVPSPESPTEELEFEDPKATPTVPGFKDAYSDSMITVGSLVATLWSYQPQTQDEFNLERGDMLEVVGVWGDGWATGRFSADRIDAWEEKHGILIDTDMADLQTGESTSLHRTQTSMVKAFPLICVCAPRHWRKAVYDAKMRGQV